MKHLTLYLGDSFSREDDAGNLRENFLHPRGNKAMEKALDFLEKWDRN